MAHNFISYNFSAVTPKVVMAWYENSSPFAEVGRVVFDGTPQFPKAGKWTVEGIRPVMHQFRFYESADGAELGQLLLTMDIDGAVTNETLADQFKYIVDRGAGEVDANGTTIWQDPVSGGTTISDKRLIGALKSELVVTFRAFGPRGDDEYDLDTVAGTISVKNGEVFSPEDRIFITRYKVMSRRVEEPSITNSLMEVHVVDSDGEFDNTYYNRNNVAAFAGLIGTTAFPSFGNIPNSSSRFSTYTGSQRYWKLQFATGDGVDFMGKTRNVIYLAPSESIEISFKDGAAYVTDHKTRYEQAGVVFGAGKLMLGAMAADGQGGQEFNVADYPRLMEELTPSQICSYPDYNETRIPGQFDGDFTAYYINRGKFALSPDGTKFKFPDLRGYSAKFLGGDDSNRFSTGPMSLQKWGVNLSKIKIELHDGEGGSSTNALGAGNNNIPAGFSGMDRFGGWLNNKAGTVPRWIRITDDGYMAVDNYGEIPQVYL